MFDELADTHDLSRCSELLLDGVEGFDGGLGTVGAEEVPGVEAGEVLQGTQDLVTTDCLLLEPYSYKPFWTDSESRLLSLESRTSGRDKAQVMRQRRVVDNSVCNHFRRSVLYYDITIMLEFLVVD